MGLPLNGFCIYLVDKGYFSALQAVVSGMARSFLQTWS